MTASERAFVHQPGAGRQIDMGAFRMTVKAESGNTAGGSRYSRPTNHLASDRRCISTATPAKRSTC